MTISVVIPCRNEKDSIKNCIEAITRNVLEEGNQLLEIIVVDGKSDDGTIIVLEQLKKNLTLLRIVENTKQVTPVAFNLGVQSSLGDFVQIVGARQIISTNYLQESLKSFESDSDIGCVGGLVINSYSNKESELIAKAMDSPFGVGGGNFRILKKSTYVDTVGTPMYKKAIFEELGLFDENLLRNQDDEFNYRLIKGGYKIFLNVNAKIKYIVRANFSKLKKQYFQYGYWKVYVNRKVKSVTTIRQLFPLALVLSKITLLILMLFSPLFFYLLILQELVYLSVALFFSSQKSSRISENFKIIYVYYILHYSYGFGYLKGIIEFLILQKEPSKSSSNLSR